MTFRISGIDPTPFAHLHALHDGDLKALGVVRTYVESKPGAPCRVTLDDAEIGESVLLFNYAHQPHDTPYRQQGPIFVREGGVRFDGLGVVPPALARRTLSLRGFDADHMMIEADLVEGVEAAILIARFFENANVAYIHAHYARRGCFAATIERA